MFKSSARNHKKEKTALATGNRALRQDDNALLPAGSAELARSLTIAALVIFLSSCVTSRHGNHPLPLKSVAHVDLHRYVGLWYEIGRYPNSFQKGCQDSTAMYTLHPDGGIDVVNSCRNEQDGSLRTARGRAWIVDKMSNSRLKISFFWPFRGDYWIIDLGRDYEYAVVGTPNRRFLWILSRTPQMEPAVLEQLLDTAEKQGFDRNKILLNRETH